MTTPLHNGLEQAYAELARQKAALAEMQDRLSAVSASVTTRNRAITVTVDCRGNVSEIKFLTGAYRSMAPAELGALLVDAIAEAKQEVTAQAAGILQEVLPGQSMFDIMRGEVDIESIVDEAVAEATGFESFFDLTGLETTGQAQRPKGTDR